MHISSIKLFQEDDMNEQELRQKIAKIESINDLLETEIMQLDLLLKQVGFKGGIKTVKKGALELKKQIELKKDCSQGL